MAGTERKGVARLYFLVKEDFLTPSALHYTRETFHSRVILLFKDITTEEEFSRVSRDDSLFTPGVKEICRRHNLDAGTLQRESVGFNIVFRVDGAVIKVYCNLWPEDYRAERASLLSVSNLPVPRILSDGRVDNWNYLVLSELEGIPIGKIWDDLQIEQKTDLLCQLGVLIRTLHAQDPGANLRNDWEKFIRQRVRCAYDHHGVEEPWKSWIRDRLSHRMPLDDASVLLHADITDEHVLLTEGADSWVINGLIDFGDAKIGHPHYDFLAPIAYLTFGEPKLTEVFLESYGLSLDKPTMESITTFCLLHEFGTLTSFLDRHPVLNPRAFCEAMWGDKLN